jgi:hypothetical protein
MERRTEGQKDRGRIGEEGRESREKEQNIETKRD